MTNPLPVRRPLPIDPEELARRIAEGEGTRIEFKQGLPSAEKIARTLAAFANTRGGLFVVGVGDRGELVGAPRPEASASEILRVAREDVEPPLEPLVAVAVLDGCTLVTCFVRRTESGPHAARLANGETEITVRLGSSTRRAEGPALEALHRGSNSRPLDVFERTALVWIERQGDTGGLAEGRATAENFSVAHNVGRRRALRAFVRLEREGHIVGHGKGLRRSYAAL